jgi:hypothetical protein
MLKAKGRNSRKDPHMSTVTPLAGKGIATPSCVGGSGGRALHHSDQQAVSAAFFATISASSSIAAVDVTDSGRFSPCLAPPDYAGDVKLLVLRRNPRNPQRDSTPLREVGA